MQLIGSENLVIPQSLSVLWLLIPQVLLLFLSHAFYRRKGWRGLAAPAAALFSGIVIVGDYVLLDAIEITGRYLESGTGHVIYVLGSNILDIFPYALLCSLLFSYDGQVLEEFHRLRGLANPHSLVNHNGKRGIVLAMVSFILPLSIFTSPIGLVRSQSKLHAILKGTMQPRGKGMVVLALGIYSGATVAASIVFGLVAAALQFAQLENYQYFNVLYENTFVHMVLENSWLTVGFPFVVVMVGGFVAQRCYGVVRAVIGGLSMVLLLISSIPDDHVGVSSATGHVGLEAVAVLMLVIALWMPQRIQGKPSEEVRA